MSSEPLGGGFAAFRLCDKIADELGIDERFKSEAFIIAGVDLYEDSASDVRSKLKDFLKASPHFAAPTTPAPESSDDAKEGSVERVPLRKKQIVTQAELNDPEWTLANRDLLSDPTAWQFEA